MCSWFRQGHHIPHATPSRVPPDPSLFPNYLQNAQGLWLRFVEWWPRCEPGAVKGAVFIVSGLGEHSGRYDSVALRLNQAGYACFSVDNQGAGGSEGVRLYVERFSHFVDDIQLFVHHILIKYPELTGLPRFLLGHSMGGLISTHVAMRDPEYFNGVVLSGPAHGSPLVGAVLRKTLGWLGSLTPKLPVKTLNALLVSTNKPVVELVANDPFYCNARLRARWGSEMLVAQDEVFNSVRTSKSSFPFLIVHGAEDSLCSPEVSRRFYEQATSTDKHYKLYEGAYHEVLTELSRETVLKDVLEFIEGRTKKV